MSSLEPQRAADLELEHRGLKMLLRTRPKAKSHLRLLKSEAAFLRALTTWTHAPQTGLVSVRRNHRAEKINYGEFSRAREPRLKLYFAQLHWVYSLQNTLFVNVTSASSLSASATTANKRSCCLTAMSQPPSAGGASATQPQTGQKHWGRTQGESRMTNADLFSFFFFFNKCALGIPWWSDQDT